MRVLTDLMVGSSLPRLKNGLNIFVDVIKFGLIDLRTMMVQGLVI